MNTNQELLAFIQSSPTAFHAVKTVRELLEQNGYEPLPEGSEWKLSRGGRYYVTRNGSALIAFRVPESDFSGFMIGASHSDSPTFKIKMNPELKAEGCIRLNTERYGGMIAASWFDRPLTCAGRVCVRTEQGIEERLIYVDRDLFVIPSLAIHMDRNINEGHSYDYQKELLPLFRSESSNTSFLKLIAQEAGCEEADVLSYDLFLAQRTPGFIFGAENEYLCSPRLDDLQCGFGDLMGFLNAKETASLPVFALFDNEEVGSLTKQGAAGTFLHDVLYRILSGLEIRDDKVYPIFANSFVVSADNAHAVHPNYPEKADPNLRPKLNGGIVIKHSGAQLYCTDAVSSAIFKEVCRRADAPFQEFANQSNIRGGSTLGNLVNGHLSLNSVDIGLPQLAMHSGFETAGTTDTQSLIDAMTEFFSSSIHRNGDLLTITK